VSRLEPALEKSQIIVESIETLRTSLARLVAGSPSETWAARHWRAEAMDVYGSFHGFAFAHCLTPLDTKNLHSLRTLLREQSLLALHADAVLVTATMETLRNTASPPALHPRP
jgi:hypothetical protein